MIYTWCFFHILGGHLWVKYPKLLNLGGKACFHPPNMVFQWIYVREELAKPETMDFTITDITEHQNIGLLANSPTKSGNWRNIPTFLLLVYI